MFNNLKTLFKQGFINCTITEAVKLTARLEKMKYRYVMAEDMKNNAIIVLEGI